MESSSNVLDFKCNSLLSVRQDVTFAQGIMVFWNITNCEYISTKRTIVFKSDVNTWVMFNFVSIWCTPMITLLIASRFFCYIIAGHVNHQHLTQVDDKSFLGFQIYFLVPRNGFVPGWSLLGQTIPTGPCEPEEFNNFSREKF